MLVVFRLLPVAAVNLAGHLRIFSVRCLHRRRLIRVGEFELVLAGTENARQ